MEKALVKKPSVLGIMAAKFRLDEAMFLNTIKATVMKPTKDGKIPSNEEIAAFLIVANKYDLDPFTNEIYAFPNKKGGIIPIVGVDGFVTIMNRRPGFDGYEMEYCEEEVTMEGAKSCPKWAEVKIFHKDREHPTIVREYLDEVYVAARGGYPGPWQSHTKRMLRHKVLIQGIRVAFGITGIYDEDEGARILEAQTVPTIMEPQSTEKAPDSPVVHHREPGEDDVTFIPEKPVLANKPTAKGPIKEMFDNEQAKKNGK
jgi:phage recombination protein Bet